MILIGRQVVRYNGLLQPARDRLFPLSLCIFPDGRRTTLQRMSLPTDHGPPALPVQAIAEIFFRVLVSQPTCLRAFLYLRFHICLGKASGARKKMRDHFRWYGGSRQRDEGQARPKRNTLFMFCKAQLSVDENMVEN